MTWFKISSKAMKFLTIFKCSNKTFLMELRVAKMTRAAIIFWIILMNNPNLKDTILINLDKGMTELITNKICTKCKFKGCKTTPLWWSNLQCKIMWICSRSNAKSKSILPQRLAIPTGLSPSLPQLSPSPNNNNRPRTKTNSFINFRPRTRNSPRS